MNNDQQITCPKCGESISIDKVLFLQVEERIKADFEKEKIAHQKTFEEKEKQLKEKEHSVDKVIEERLNEKLIKEKAEAIKNAKIQIEKEKEQEFKIIQEELKEKEEKLKKANEESLLLRKERKELEDAKQEFEINLQRKLDEERQKIKEESSKKVAEEYQFTVAQLKKQLNDATKAKDELSRKLEQGSQQLQGEVLELELENILKTEFPLDEIIPVPKGVNGADVIQKVHDKNGRLCGQIIWESKRAKNWKEDWVSKLKDDQREAKAEIAVIVSTVMPNDIKNFKYRDGVWVCSIDLAIALATALRSTLESVAREKIMSVGKNEKMEIIYSYLTGTEFRQRVETIVEAFSSMKLDLDKEKLAYQKMWAKREKQIERVVHNTIGLYGDLSGLAPLQEIKMLELEEEEEL